MHNLTGVTHDSQRGNSVTKGLSTKSVQKTKDETQSRNSSDAALPQGGATDFVSLQLRRRCSLRNTSNPHQMAEMDAR